MAKKLKTGSFDLSFLVVCDIQSNKFQIFSWKIANKLLIFYLKILTNFISDFSDFIFSEW
jgi:hypothetical protein